MEISSKQMHDVRNYVQTLAQSISNITDFNKEQQKFLNKENGRFYGNIGQNNIDISQNNQQQQIKCSNNSKQDSIKDNIFYIKSRQKFNYLQIDNKNFSNENEKISNDDKNFSNENEKICNDDKNFSNENDHNDGHYNNPENFKRQNLHKNIKIYEDKISKKIPKIVSNKERKNLTKLINIRKEENLLDYLFLENNFQKIDKPQELDLDISFDNQSIINDITENHHLEDDNNFDKSFKSDLNISCNKQSKKFNFESKLYNQMNNNPYYLNDIIKFVNQKINFLQHIDLAFEKNQIIKEILVNPTDLLNQICKMLKILFINKSNSVSIQIKSSYSKLNLDIHMLKQLICQYVIKLHEKNIKKIDIILNFEHMKERRNNREKLKYIIYIEFKFENLTGKIINLQNKPIFNIIINNIRHRSTNKQLIDEKTNKHRIEISQSTIYKIEDLYSFDEKVLIKDDKVSLSNNNVQLQSNKEIFIFENKVYINIDDELNIQSMHSLIFSRVNIKLNCCSNQEELVEILMIVYRDYNNLKPLIVILLDHELDGQKGKQVQQRVEELRLRFDLNIQWVLVSSTEDENTINDYKQIGLDQFIDKPLNITKVNQLDKYLNENKISQ